MKAAFYRSAGTFQVRPRYKRTRSKSRVIQKRHGLDRRKRMYFEEEEAPDYEEGRTDYTKHQLQLMADEMLRDDARSELCRVCEKRGSETGNVESRLQQGITDTEGNALSLDFPEYECGNGHRWYKGEG